MPKFGDCNIISDVTSIPDDLLSFNYSMQHNQIVLIDFILSEILVLIMRKRLRLEDRRLHKTNHVDVMSLVKAIIMIRARCTGFILVTTKNGWLMIFFLARVPKSW